MLSPLSFCIILDLDNTLNKIQYFSSRSHCLTTLLLTKVLEDEQGKKLVSQTLMQFVDLSGSERTSKTGLSGKQEIHGTVQGWEGIAINMDLWALGINSLLPAKQSILILLYQGLQYQTRQD